MLFNASQHLKMADLLNKKAKAQHDPKKAEKRLAMAKVFRTLAHKAEQKSKMPKCKRYEGSGA